MNAKQCKIEIYNYPNGRDRDWRLFDEGDQRVMSAFVNPAGVFVPMIDSHSVKSIEGLAMCHELLDAAWAYFQTIAPVKGAEK